MDVAIVAYNGASAYNGWADAEKKNKARLFHNGLPSELQNHVLDWADVNKMYGYALHVQGFEFVSVWVGARVCPRTHRLPHVISEPYKHLHTCTHTHAAIQAFAHMHAHAHARTLTHI